MLITMGMFTYLTSTGGTVKNGMPAFSGLHQSGYDPLYGGKQGLELVRILEASSKSLKRGGASVNLSGPDNATVDAVNSRNCHTHINLGNRKEESSPPRRQKATFEL